MKYLVIGLLLGIGWQAAELAFGIVSEIIFTNLHNANWYQILCRKKEKTDKHTMKVKSVKNKIGFE